MYVAGGCGSVQSMTQLARSIDGSAPPTTDFEAGLRSPCQIPFKINSLITRIRIRRPQHKAQRQDGDGLKPRINQRKPLVMFPKC